MSELDVALAAARAAVLAAPDPAAAAARLARWSRRERQWQVTPAALAVEQVVAARGAGARLQEFAAGPGPGRT